MKMLHLHFCNCIKLYVYSFTITTAKSVEILFADSARMAEVELGQVESVRLESSHQYFRAPTGRKL